jgi:undecaprenyl-diphosphatase
VNLFEAIVLGIIQGLTEFLPISSTAHLTLAARVLDLVDMRSPEGWTAFMAIMQLGTMFAVQLYFWRDLVQIPPAMLRDLRTVFSGGGVRALSAPSKLLWFMVIGTVPVAFVGLFFHKVIEGVFTKSIPVIACSLIALALLLWLAERLARHVRTMEEVRWTDAILVGCAQAMALIPGSSRSGTTMTAALFLGFTRNAAARFSFLLSIPAVLLSGVYELFKVYQMISTGTDVFTFGITNLIVATIVSALSGYAAIAWLLRYLIKNTTMVFVVYRVALGALLLCLLALHIIQP